MSKAVEKRHRREPFIHIAKRDAMPWWKSWLVRIIAILAALVVAGVVTVLLTGTNPIAVYASMFEGAFGTPRRIWRLFQGIAILLCISLAITPAFKMKFWNCGAEGQVLMGGLASAMCMILIGNRVPYPILLVIIVLASIMAGAVWAVIPAIFKAYYGTNETLFTLMMNYVAMQIVAYFVYVNAVPAGSGQIQFIEAGHLPMIGEYKYLLNILIVAVLTVLMFIYLKYSKHGYEISVVGESQNTARYIGINVKKVIIRTMLVTGALCGIAGMLLVAGTDHTINKETVGGYGFTAIMVAWLAKFNPVYMSLTTFLIIFLEMGADQIATQFGFNNAYADIITGIIIFFIVGSEFFVQYAVKFRRTQKEQKEVKAS